MVKRLSLKLRRRGRDRQQPEQQEQLRGETALAYPAIAAQKVEKAYSQYNYTPAQTRHQPQPCKFKDESTADLTSFADPPIPSEITVCCAGGSRIHEPAQGQTGDQNQHEAESDSDAQSDGGNSTNSKNSASSQHYPKPTVTYGHQDIVWEVTRRTLPRDCRATRHWLHELDTSSGSGSSRSENDGNSYEQGSLEYDNLSDEEMLARVFNLDEGRAPAPPPQRSTVATEPPAAAASAKPPTYEECVQLGLFDGPTSATPADGQAQSEKTHAAQEQEEIDDIVASLSLRSGEAAASSASPAADATPSASAPSSSSSSSAQEGLGLHVHALPPVGSLYPMLGGASTGVHVESASPSRVSSS